MDIVKKKKAIREKVFNPNMDDRNNSVMTFAFASANINRYLPDVAYTEYEDFYKHMRYYSYITTLDQYDYEVLNHMNIINNTEYDVNENLHNTPIIFATFHFGSYRLINSFLLIKGYKVVLIIDEIAYKDQFNSIVDVYSTYKKQHPENDSDYIILNVKEPSAIFRLNKLLKAGYVLVVYLDGNKGLLHDNADNKGFINIDFLNSSIPVKIGIGIIAALLKATIIPVFNYWNEANDKTTLEFLPGIHCNDNEDRNDFAIKAIKQCYNHLEEKIIKFPMQWECWLYLHEWLNKSFELNYFPNPAPLYAFNEKRYMLLAIQANKYIFDKDCYLSYDISETTYELLIQNNFSDLPDKLLTQLLSMNVIV